MSDRSLEVTSKSHAFFEFPVASKTTTRHSTRYLREGSPHGRCGTDASQPIKTGRISGGQRINYHWKVQFNELAS